MYRHDWMCIDIHALIVAFIVAFAFSYVGVSYIQVSKRMVRALGIEPRTPAWKAGVLPLNYARKQEALIKPFVSSGSRWNSVTTG